MRGGIGQSPQDPWAAESVATFIHCVDDKDESTFWGVRKFADEFEEERVLHRSWGQVWVVAKAFGHDASKRGEYSRELVDESRQDISWLAQVPIISPAEERASEMVSLVKHRTN